MNGYDDEYNYEQRPARRRSPMVTASVVLGILSIVLCSAFYIALPCGALAVICAILSRGEQPMAARSKVGMICGILGMVVSVVVTVSALRYVLTTETGRSYLEYYYQMYTGDFDFDLDEALDELFPFLDDSQDEPGGNSGEDSSDDSEYPDSTSPREQQPDDSSPQQNNDNAAEEGGFI
ncbi:MAG: hypothetical protein LUH07_05910 [Lachnospiraceae bacterium]|nr:hypothetical protein [Lachnospiraceae bacterium]